MTTLYTSEMTNLLSTPPVALSPLDQHGRLRIATATYVCAANGSDGDLVQLCKLPAGRVRLFGRLSSLYHNLTTGSATLDLGWAAYTNLDGVAVAADGDGLDDGIDTEAAGTINVGTVAAVAAVGSIKTFESQTGVVLTATLVKAPVATDVLKGFFVYVLD